MSLKGQVARSAMWSGVQIAGNQATSFAVFLVLTHLLSPAEIGVAALAMSFIEVVTPLMRAGLPEALIQRAELREIDADTCFWSSLGLSGLLAGALAALAPLIGRGFGSPALAPVIAMLSLLLPISALSATHEARITRAFNFRALAVRTVVGNLLGGIVGVVMAVQGFGVWSLVAQRLVGSAAGVVLIWATYRWVPRLRFSGAALRGLGRFGVHMTVVSFLGSLNSRIFDFLLGFFLGPAAVGYVRVATRCMDMVTQFAVNPLTSVTLPTLSRLQGDPEAFGRAMRKLVQSSALLTFPAYFGLALVAPDVVPLAFGRQWALSGTLLSILCISAGPITLQYFIWPALAAVGRTDRASQGIAAIVFTAILFTAGAYRFGLQAVVIAHVARTFLTLPLSLALLRRYTGVDAKSLIISIAPPFIAASTMVIALTLASHALGSTTAMARIVALSGLGAVIYGGLMFAIARPLLRDMRHALRPS